MPAQPINRKFFQSSWCSSNASMGGINGYSPPCNFRNEELKKDCVYYSGRCVGIIKKVQELLPPGYIGIHHRWGSLVAQIGLNGSSFCPKANHLYPILEAKA